MYANFASVAVFAKKLLYTYLITIQYLHDIPRV